MPKRYFIKLSFDGTRYCGWQIQENAASVQETLDKALSTLLREPICTVGAGRTDTGVHARKFYAHFDTSAILDDEHLALTVYKLNRILPPDIAIQGIFPVNPDAHARFDAKSRTYQYYMCTQKDPFCHGKAWLMEPKLDIPTMQQAADMLPEFDDFSSFAKSNTQTKTNRCKVFHAKWTKQGHLLVFEIKADRFLRNMVRAITGTLVDIGLGKIDLNDFAGIIEAQDRRKAGYSAPGYGLYLVDIEYPEELRVAGCRITGL
jgi:tRNA pseudouridine38-40 synthase